MSDKSGYYRYDERSFESLDAFGGIDFLLIEESDNCSSEKDQYSLESVFDPDDNIAEGFI